MIVFYNLNEIADDLMFLISVNDLYRDQKWNSSIIGLIDITDMSTNLLYKPQYYVEHNDRRYMFATAYSVLDKFKQFDGTEVIVKIDRRVLRDLL